MLLSWFDRWMLKRIARKAVRQGWHHAANMTLYYKILNDAARTEFNEDSGIALNAFLKERHQEALPTNIVP